MAAGDALLDEVRALVAEAGRTIVLPRFRNLAGDEVSLKRKSEVVTVADTEAERWLRERFGALMPEALFLGEESVEGEPELLGALTSDRPVFIVDPVDGTKNFSEGSERFCVMVALWDEGRPVASWIYLPVTDEMAEAREGAGAYLQEARLSGRGARAPQEADASIHLQFLPKRIGAAVGPRANRLRSNTEYMCAGHTYLDLARGRLDCALFWRTKPWDHLPGALLLKEAGGEVRHFDGTAYRGFDHDRRGLFAAGHAGGWPALSGFVLDDLAEGDRRYREA